MRKHLKLPWPIADKKLDKIERIEVDVEDTTAMKLRFPVAQQPGKVVLRLKAYRKLRYKHTS